MMRKIALSLSEQPCAHKEHSGNQFFPQRKSMPCKVGRLTEDEKATCGSQTEGDCCKVRPQGKPRSAHSDPLDHQRNPLPYANTHGAQGITTALNVQAIDGGGH